MSAFATHFAFEFKTGLRNPTQLLMNYLFPLGFYAMMGAIMTQVNPGFKELLMPAMATFAVMVCTLLGLPGPLVDAREAGIFRSFKINGVPALSIMAIPALSTIFHGLIVAAIIALTAVPLFGGQAPAHPEMFALVVVVAAMAFGALATLIGVVADSSRTTVLLSQAIFLPSMLLGGMMVPVTMLPESLRPFAGLLPTTHVMQALLGLAYGQGSALHPVESLLVLAAGALLGAALAIYLFNWDSRNSSRRGHPALALLALAPYLAAVFLK